MTDSPRGVIYVLLTLATNARHDTDPVVSSVAVGCTGMHMARKVPSVFQLQGVLVGVFILAQRHRK